MRLGCGERDGVDEVLCSVIGNQPQTPLGNCESADRPTPRALPAALPRAGPFLLRDIFQHSPRMSHDGCVRLAVRPGRLLV